MKILSEEEVYIGTKEILKKNNFKILAGQPARGTDHLPVIEIKSGDNFDKGSKDSYKPDLVAFKDNIFFIIECKPKYDLPDSLKLKSILNCEDRLYAFYIELNQRKLFSKIHYIQNFDVFKKSIKGVLAYSGKHTEDTGLMHIIVSNFMGMGHIINL